MSFFNGSILRFCGLFRFKFQKNLTVRFWPSRTKPNRFPRKSGNVSRYSLFLECHQTTHIMNIIMHITNIRIVWHPLNTHKHNHCDFTLKSGCIVLKITTFWEKNLSHSATILDQASHQVGRFECWWIYNVLDLEANIVTLCILHVLGTPCIMETTYVWVFGDINF